MSDDDGSASARVPAPNIAVAPGSVEQNAGPNTTARAEQRANAATQQATGEATATVSEEVNQASALSGDEDASVLSRTPLPSTSRQSTSVDPVGEDMQSSASATDSAPRAPSGAHTGEIPTLGTGEWVPFQAQGRNHTGANAPSAASQPPARGNAATATRTTSSAAPGDDEGSSTSSQASPDATASRSRIGGGLGSMGAPDFEESTNVGHELELSVPSHQEHLTSDGQRYTTYEIVVRTGGLQWSVRKRYSQFDAFRHSLRKQHKEVGSFRFPNKSKFNTFSEHTKERRRTGFDEFLRLVAGLHPRPQEVDVFLAMDEHGAGVRGRSAGRPMTWTMSGSVSPLPARASGPALGPMWPEGLRADEERRLGPGVGRRPSGSRNQMIPRFPPLADQGRSKKATEAAVATAPSRSGPSGFVRKVDLMLKQLLGPYLLSVLCVVAVSAVCIVVVWKVGGKPGLATLVIAVSVGLFIQNWDRGVDMLNFGLEWLGLSTAELQEAPPPPSARGALRPADQARRSQIGGASMVRSQTVRDDI